MYSNRNPVRKAYMHFVTYNDTNGSCCDIIFDHVMKMILESCFHPAKINFFDELDKEEVLDNNSKEST